MPINYSGYVYPTGTLPGQKGPVPTRWMGRLDGGHPTIGTFFAGDWTLDLTTPGIWVCDLAGSPGAWVNLISTGSLTGLQVVTPTGDSTGGADLSAINALMAAGKAVQLVGSPFFIDGPLSPIPGSVLLGLNGGVYGQSAHQSAMTRIVGVGNLSSMWSQAANVAFCRLQDIMFDATAATLSGPCVNLVDGTVEEDRTHLTRVYVESPTLDAFYIGTAHQDLKLSECIVHSAGQHGFNIKASDALLYGCIAGDCIANGYEIQATGAELHGSASFKNSRGVVVASTIKDFAMFGGSLDRNSNEGLYVNAGCDTITINGTQFHSNDYTNTGAGNVHCDSTIAEALSLNGCVFPPLDADASFTPPFNITTVAGALVLVNGCSFDPTSASAIVDAIGRIIGNINGVTFPLQATTVGAPPYTKGGIYYDTTLNKLRIGGASGWETVTSA